MAGQFANGANHKTSTQDILFDLTPEDTKQLQESDLLQLVNYGQLSKAVEVLGTNGRKYSIELALLWDEDYVDILKKTQTYSEDSILRVKVLRRLKLYKAIQSIDDRLYNDPGEAQAQRELWTLLCRLSDVQMDLLDSKYHELELERDLTIVEAMGIMGEGFQEQTGNKPATPTEEAVVENDTPEVKDTKEEVSIPENEHTALFAKIDKQEKEINSTLTNITTEMIEGQPVNNVPKEPLVDIEEEPVDEGVVQQIGSPKRKKQHKKKL